MVIATSASLGGAVDDRALYAQSFGNLPHGTIYSAGLKSFDGRAQLRESMSNNYKSFMTTSGGAGTAGFAMIPVYVDSRIVDISRRYTPLTELIPRVANQGISADYNRVTAKGAATTAQEDAALIDVTHTRERVSKSIKFLYSVGRVTGPAIAAVPAYTLEGFQPTGSQTGGSPFASNPAGNALQQEVLLAARALKELEENLVVVGSETSSVGSGPDGTEFDGLITQQGSTNVLDLNGASITWDNVETAVRTSFDNGGRVSLAVASSNVVTDLRKIMIDTFRMSPADNTTEIAFGISAQLVLQTMVGRVPVIPSQYLSIVSGSKQIIFLDMDFIEMRVLQDMTFEELAKTNDSRKFMLKIYEALVVRAPEFNALIDNIS
jgi:hypothetical protein